MSITSKVRAEASSNGGAVARVRERRPIRVAWSAVHRFIEADGTSHTRALGYQTFLMVLSGFIGLIGPRAPCTLPSSDRSSSTS